MKTRNFFLILLAVWFVNCTGAQKAEDTAAAEETKEEPAAEASATFANGSYTVAPGQVLWHATKVTGEHNGTVAIKDGSFMVEGGAIKGGSFDIDLTTIDAVDLKDDAETKAKLEGHLKSADFFDAANSPVATFNFTEIVEGGEGDASHTINGTLTIKNITKDISFPASIAPVDGSMKIKSEFKLDRTEWDIKYGSGKFFEGLGDKLIHDEFTITLDLEAMPNTNA